MKTKKEVKPYEYEYEDFTPGFIFATVLSVVIMLAIVVLFALIIASGVIYIGGVL